MVDFNKINGMVDAAKAADLQIPVFDDDLNLVCLHHSPAGSPVALHIYNGSTEYTVMWCEGEPYYMPDDVPF